MAYGAGAALLTNGPVRPVDSPANPGPFWEKKMTLGKLVLKVVAAVSFAVCASAASASAITISFSSTLTSSLGSLNTGDAFSGSYTFDPTIAATATSTSNTAVFDNLLGASLTIGSFTATVGPGVGLAEIQQDHAVGGEDRYGLVARNPVGSSQIGGLDITSFGFRLDDFTETTIADALTLLTNPVLADFSPATFLIFFGQPTDTNFQVVTGAFSARACNLGSYRSRPGGSGIRATAAIGVPAFIDVVALDPRIRGPVALS